MKKTLMLAAGDTLTLVAAPASSSFSASVFRKNTSRAIPINLLYKMDHANSLNTFNANQLKRLPQDLHLGANIVKILQPSNTIFH